MSADLKPFLEPRSVALVGVPRRTGRGSFNILEILLGMGFPGRVYPVNPQAKDILGVPAYPSLKAIPEAPDLAVMMLPREAVPPTLEDCVRRGIRAAIVVSDGFAEADAEGKKLQARLVEIVRGSGCRLVGPNSLGVVNNFARFTTTFLPVPKGAPPLALVSQSGGFFAGFANFVPGKALDLGNMADVDFADALDHFAADPAIRVIALHIEGLKDGRRFLASARRVAREKPVLVLKTGRSELAKKTAATHTGSLAGSDQVFDALCHQAGLIRVKDGDELGDIAGAFQHLPPFTGNRLGIITPTGGGAVLALDSLEKYGFTLAKLSQAAVERLRPLWPPWSVPSNPVDMMSPGIMHGYKQAYQESLGALLADPGVDVILCIAGIPTLKTVKEALGDTKKPVATWVIGPWKEDLLARVEEVSYRAVYPTPERALRALAAVRDFSRLK